MQKVLFVSLILLIILFVISLRERARARRGITPVRTGNKPFHPNTPDEELLALVIDEVAIDLGMYGEMRAAFKQNVYDVKKDEYLEAIGQDRESIKGLLYLFAANFAADNLESGRFHTRRRTLTMQGQNLMSVFRLATKRCVECGLLSPQQGDDNIRAVSKSVFLG